jgi:hypothetical protein
MKRQQMKLQEIKAKERLHHEEQQREVEKESINDGSNMKNAAGKLVAEGQRRKPVPKRQDEQQLRNYKANGVEGRDALASEVQETFEGVMGELHSVQTALRKERRRQKQKRRAEKHLKKQAQHAKDAKKSAPRHKSGVQSGRADLGGLRSASKRFAETKRQRGKEKENISSQHQPTTQPAQKPLGSDVRPWAKVRPAGLIMYELNALAHHEFVL